MPNQPKTRVRGFRIPDPIWEQMERIAEDRGHETMTEYLLALIERDIREHPIGDA